MPTSIMDVLKTYPRESLDSNTMCDPPAEMELIAERWDLEALPADLVNLWTSTGECRLHHDIGSGKSESRFSRRQHPPNAPNENYASGERRRPPQEHRHSLRDHRRAGRVPRIRHQRQRIQYPYGVDAR